MDFRFLLVSTILSVLMLHTSNGTIHGEKHKVLLQVPTHIRQHVHTIYKIVKVPVFVKEAKGRQDHHDGHPHGQPRKVEHSGKFEHQHLHKHLHEHHGEVKTAPVNHHHHHTHDGDVGVNHKHQGNIAHQYHGKVAHGHSGSVDHDHLGFVGHYHGGAVGHQHKGTVGHYHGGLVGHTHEGNVDHKHKGNVAHSHDGVVGHGHIGNVGHEHAGHVGHGHKGLVGHRHFGDIRHGHDGNVGHGHSGHVEHGHVGHISHGHGGFVDHDHDGYTSHIHDGHDGYIHDGHTEDNYSDVGNLNHQNPDELVETIQGPEDGRDQMNEKNVHYLLRPSEKPGYYEYAVGSPGQAVHSGDGFLPLSYTSGLGIEEVAATLGEAIGEQNHIISEQVEDGNNVENDSGTVEYVDAQVLQQQPQQYEVFENPGY